jgi:hypothetical protein
MQKLRRFSRTCGRARTRMILALEAPDLQLVLALNLRGTIRNLRHGRVLMWAQSHKEEAMANNGSETSRKDERSKEYVNGGKGRTDDVRGSGVYPASSPDAPSTAEVRTARDFVKHRGPKPKGFKRAI